jgi:hypothetical protein
MNSIDSLSAEDYRRILNSLDSVQRWQWDSEFTSQRLTEVPSAAVDEVVEGRFQHSATSGKLYFLMPDLGEPPGSIRCLLEQPFDTDIPAGSMFLNVLNTAFGRLISDYNQPYISAVSDPNTVLSVSVPVEYSEKRVGVAGEVAADISEEVADLYLGVNKSVRQEK